MTRKSSAVDIYRNRPVVLFLISAFATIFVTSCTKVPTTPAVNAKFIGSWAGTNVCYTTQGTGDTISVPPGVTSTISAVKDIGAGSSDNALEIGVAFGGNGCYKANFLTATANNNLFSFPTQTFEDNCGFTYMISGNGELSTSGGISITYNINAGSGIVTTCVFTGEKE
jgi:hypothetical protein